MANRAEVLVKNLFSGESVRVLRKPAPETVDFDEPVDGGGEQQVSLLSPDVSLVIEAPPGKDLKLCQFKVDAAVDLEVIKSRTDSLWSVKIVPNELDPETPTTVNISIGDIDTE